jgi:hypothetical protein
MQLSEFETLMFLQNEFVKADDKLAMIVFWFLSKQTNLCESALSFLKRIGVGLYNERKNLLRVDQLCFCVDSRMRP